MRTGLGAKLLDKARMELLDPLPHRVARSVRVAVRAGIVGGISPRAVPRSLELIAREGLNVRTMVALHALNHPDRPAVTDAHRTLTYAQLDSEVNRLADALATRHGVRRRTAVVLMMENCAEYIVAWLALLRLGARTVHASYRLTPAELEHQVRDSGARVVLATATAAPTIDSLIANGGAPLLPIRVGDEPVAPPWVAYEELLRHGNDRFPRREKGAVASDNVVYTSGTTGKPKGALRDFTQFGITEMARVLDRLPFRNGDRHLIVAPLYHSGGQVFALIHLGLAATLTLLPHFEPAAALFAMSRERIHSVFMVPTMLQRILLLPDEVHARFPTPDLTAIVCGAAAFPAAMREQAIRRFGAAVIHDFYGATELGWVTIVDGREMLSKPTSVGRPLPGQEIRILDADGRALPTGTPGIIYVRNEQTMEGYLNNAAASREGRRGPWVTVEDMGVLDEDGYLTLSGRARDMVISGGVNIYPVEIEEVLAKHPHVREVAVIGVPDPDWGEALVAVVVPEGERIDTDDLALFARARLASFKVPRRYELMEALPRNPTGKVLKGVLRDRFRGAAPAPGSS